jgi:hypothetical protein
VIEKAGVISRRKANDYRVKRTLIYWATKSPADLKKNLKHLFPGMVQKIWKIIH